MVPRRPGDRVKTNRRDCLSLVKLLRARELTAIWVPDAPQEAMRDLVRAQCDARGLERCRQRIGGFLLRSASSGPSPTPPHQRLPGKAEMRPDQKITANKKGDRSTTRRIADASAWKRDAGQGSPCPSSGAASGPHSNSVQGSPATYPRSGDPTHASEIDQPSLLARFQTSAPASHLPNLPSLRCAKIVAAALLNKRTSEDEEKARMASSGDARFNLASSRGAARSAASGRTQGVDAADISPVLDAQALVFL